MKTGKELTIKSRTLSNLLKYHIEIGWRLFLQIYTPISRGLSLNTPTSGDSRSNSPGTYQIISQWNTPTSRGRCRIYWNLTLTGLTLVSTTQRTKWLNWKNLYPYLQGDSLNNLSIEIPRLRGDSNRSIPRSWCLDKTSIPQRADFQLSLKYPDLHGVDSETFYTPIYTGNQIAGP